jgi:hypothetical protein
VYAAATSSSEAVEAVDGTMGMPAVSAARASKMSPWPKRAVQVRGPDHEGASLLLPGQFDARVALADVGETARHQSVTFEDHALCFLTRHLIEGQTHGMCATDHSRQRGVGIVTLSVYLSTYALPHAPSASHGTQSRTRSWGRFVPPSSLRSRWQGVRQYLCSTELCLAQIDTDHAAWVVREDMSLQIGDY